VRKEIYTYKAPWTTYALGWSHKDPSSRFRLAVGSFKEEYSNQVSYSSSLYICVCLCVYSLHSTISIIKKDTPTRSSVDILSCLFLKPLLLWS
jgi:hypothetical protein